MVKVSGACSTEKLQFSLPSWDVFTPPTQQTVVASTIAYVETSSLLAVTFQMIFLGKKKLVDLFLPELGQLVTEANIDCALRQEVRLLPAEENYRYMCRQV